MHWTVDDLLNLPVEYYDTLIEMAPKWLGTHSDES